MYKLSEPNRNGKITSLLRLPDGACIPFDPANTDYAKFKDAVNAGKAQLQDADGKTMTAEQAKDLVKELP